MGIRARRPSPRGGTYVGLEVAGVGGADADPSPFHEGTATPCYCATVSCWWHFPIDLDESCQDRVSPPRAEAFSARRNVRWPGSARCPRGRRRSFAFSRGNCHTLLLCHSQLLVAFPDRSRRELSGSRVPSPRGGLLRAAERTLAWICPVSAAQTQILRLFTRSKAPRCLSRARERA